MRFSTHSQEKCYIRQMGGAGVISNPQCWNICKVGAITALKTYMMKKERARVCGIDESAVRKDVLAIVLEEPLEVSAAKAQKVYNRGRWPGFYFTKGGYGGIARKTYLENVGGRLPTNLWMYEETGHTDEAKKRAYQLVRWAFSV